VFVSVENGGRSVCGALCAVCCVVVARGMCVYLSCQSLSVLHAFGTGVAQVSLHTILSLSLPILYGVCHIKIKRGSRRGHILRKGRTLVLQ